jgi:cytochrome P450
MMNFLSDDLRRDPFPLYEQVRSSSPLLHEPQSDMWLVFDYESVKRVMSDHDAFSSIVTPPTGKAPDWLVFSDPPRHTKLRGIIMRAFTPRSIANLEPRIRALSRELLAPTIERGQMDLALEYSNLLPTIVIAEMIGIPVVDRARFLRWGETIMNLSYAIAGGEEAAKAVQENAVVKEEMRAYLKEVLPERRKAPKDDLLTRLAEAEVDGERLTEEEILGFFQLLLSAGTETTTNLINNAILCLIENPDQLAHLRAGPHLLPSAIEEVLRYRSPGQIIFRSTKRDIELHGQVIPAGKLVLVMIGSANRDPMKFRDPDRFDITRDPNPHVAFGHGIHFCLGASLSRLEAKVALEDLLEQMKGFELASPEPWEPRKGLHIHGPLRLPIRFEPGRPAAALA